MSYVAYQIMEPEMEQGFRTSVQKVGAHDNRLDDIAARIAAVFGDSLGCREKFFIKDKEVEGPECGDWHDTVDTVRTYQWMIHGVPHVVDLQHVGMPVPVSGRYVHHAAVTTPEGEMDAITPIIWHALKGYEAE